ncbi:hypothetical protein [Spirosoma endbachense]|uniref:Uncharacterized protein n=1 Tax=Spirosoma endbachense TaxID=2666025 RepID=A0A6P1W5Z1_9BACT|nr:hypothetical protein [Spirosoma endbachense]QHV99350.1 hypothetical protein GJR95_31985 [Spirosoma endbachense]
MLGLLLLFGHCSRRQYPDSHAASCYPNHPYDTTSYQWTTPPDSLLTQLLPRYSRYNLMVAHAAGLLPLLQSYQLHRAKLRQDSSLARRFLVAEQKARIQDRVALFRTQVASLAAELDCEALRVNRLIVYQDRLEQVRIRNLTVSSILTGAIGGVAAALLPENASKATAITAGLGSSILGLLSLHSGRRIPLEHPRNLLRDIWYAPVHSDQYPAMVWNMLSQPVFSSSGRYPVAYLLRNQWIDIEGLTLHQKKNDQKIELLLSRGGYYGVDELKLRTDLINQLQAAIKLIDQDIQGLLSQFSSLP